jgi:predicted XRE-type DNA-binding protein
MKNCRKCEHRVELNPQYQSMAWEELPCSQCSIPSLHDDAPSARMVLMEPQKMARIYEAEGFASKPLMRIKTTEALLELMTRIRDAVDLKIVQTIIRDRDATQAEIAAAVGMTQPAISARLKRMRL